MNPPNTTTTSVGAGILSAILVWLLKHVFKIEISGEMAVGIATVIITLATRFLAAKTTAK